LSLRLSVEGLPPALPPSGACLWLGSRVLDAPRNAAEGYTKPGLRLCRGLCRGPSEPCCVEGTVTLAPYRLRLPPAAGGPWPPGRPRAHGP
jgi:hypothetical protein